MGADLQNLVLGVVADHERDGNAVSGCGPQPLNTVQRRPFSEDRQHGPLGPGEFDADTAAQSPAQGPAAMAEIASWVVDGAQPFEQRAGRGDRLFHDGDVLRQ